MRKLLIALLVVSLLPTSATAETRIPGSACTKLGEIKVVNALTYKCQKASRYQVAVTGSKYIWNKGKLAAIAPNPNSFDNRKFGDGAIVGTDIKPGRYWSINCVGWKHYDDNGLISKWLSNSQQSLVDLKTGETLLSGCRWIAGEPLTAKILPTGKLSMKTQLVPGRYRPVNELCMTGPTDTRSTWGISSDTDVLVWEQLAKSYELVITGKENWIAYGVTIECGGLKRLD